jgi:hypothetical protein
MILYLHPNIPLYIVIHYIPNKKAAREFAAFRHDRQRKNAGGSERPSFNANKIVAEIRPPFSPEADEDGVG